MGGGFERRKRGRRERGREERGAILAFYPFMNSRTTPTGPGPSYAVMQKLSQARSELRLAAGSSDKGIQKLQFLKVLSRLDGRGEFSHRLRLAASSSSSFSISTVPSLCKLTRFAGKRLRKCDCDGEERRERGGRRLKEKERRLKIGGGGLLLAVLVFQHRSRYVHIYIYIPTTPRPRVFPMSGK